MKVNKNSWHYKTITEETLGVGGCSQYFVSHSLCTYFWQVIASILLKGTLLLVILPAGLSLFVTLPLISLVGWLVTGSLVEGDLGLIILFAEVLAVLIWLIVIGVDILRNKFNDYRYVKESVDKGPSLVGQYIKAKKDKICPIIEFVEEE